MGFLKFLKREKRESIDELDLPPAPPSLEGFEEGMELPEFPEFPEEKISAPQKQDFDFGKEELPELEYEIPEMGQKPQIQPIIAPAAQVAPMPAMSAPQPMPTPPEPNEEPSPPEEPRFAPLDDYAKVERRLFAQEKRALRERPTARTIYVKVDKFKATLGSISTVRSDLRKSEEALMKLESIKNSKDRAFDKVRNSVDDLQKKLIFIDKTLFEGE